MAAEKQVVVAPMSLQKNGTALTDCTDNGSQSKYTAPMHVVVTGASQGIGAAIAESFAAEPETKLSLMARNERNLNKVAERCRAAGAEVAIHLCDVTWDDQVEAVADAILEMFGPPQIVVNNAGKFRPATALEMDGALLRKQFDENVVSALLVSQAFLPSMIEAQDGHLFFLGSVASIGAYPGAAAYCAAKHGLLGLARAIRSETRDEGVRVTTILPGATWTPSWGDTPIPEERMMPARDVAAAIVACASLGRRSVVEELLIRPQRGDV
jgi:NAD(P)-dependent dehydrogenase (short-subunit alcohol dehydrogenase family)